MTAIEYGLVAAGIAVAIAVTVGLVGADLQPKKPNLYEKIKMVEPETQHILWVTTTNKNVRAYNSETGALIMEITREAVE